MVDRVDEALETQVAWGNYWKQPVITSWFKEHTRSSEVYANNIQSQSLALMTALLFGECFACTPPICELLYSAEQKLPEDTILFNEMLPSVSGFLYFAQPWLWEDSSAERGFRALSWVAVHQDDKQAPAVAIPGLVQLDSIETVAVTFWAEPPVGSLGIPLSTYMVPCGRAIREDEIRPTATGEDQIARMKATMRRKIGLFLATLLFLEQQILVAERTQPGRSTRRRLEKISTDPVRSYRVIRLRRVANRNGQAAVADVEWACRWFVKGHWRNQWHPKLRRHSPAWIRPHIKGPSDKPLKAPTPTVFSVER